jgi:hypothetical protein
MPTEDMEVKVLCKKKNNNNILTEIALFFRSPKHSVEEKGRTQKQSLPQYCLGSI